MDTEGHINGEFTDLEFENHKSVRKGIFRTLEQAGANICSLGYQNSNFKIGLSYIYCTKYKMCNGNGYYAPC